jgi:hypothetical protein
MLTVVAQAVEALRRRGAKAGWWTRFVPAVAEAIRAALLTGGAPLVGEAVALVAGLKFTAAVVAAEQSGGATDLAAAALLIGVAARLAAELVRGADAGAVAARHERRWTDARAKVGGIGRRIEIVGWTLADADALRRAANVPAGTRTGAAGAVDARFADRTRDPADRRWLPARAADADQCQDAPGGTPGQRAEYLPTRRVLGQMQDERIELFAVHTRVVL